VSEAGVRQPQLQADWLEVLGGEFREPYMQELSAFLRQRRAGGAQVYPPPRDIFRAFWATPPQRVRVVIIGQDPYHNPGQAHGLSFSVPPGVAVPPSLRNLYVELHSDLGLRPASHGYLMPWAERGVLLLNSVLTVEANQPAAHRGKGWERFTDRVVDYLAAREQPTVFMLWGAYAQQKGRRIDRGRHRLLEAPHPSPLSAHRGFFGCRHFSQANEFLREVGLGEIDWQLPERPVP
jgi:uracil-DNA glycosylase